MDDVLKIVNKKKSFFFQTPPKINLAALQLPYSRAYSTAWEMRMVIGYDSLSEIPRYELDGEECKRR